MQQTRSPVLVLGATGGQGGAVVDALLTHRSPVRALVRDPASPAARRLRSRGVEVVPGSLDDRDSLSTAMRGVANVFAVTTRSRRARRRRSPRDVRSWERQGTLACRTWC